MVIDDGCTLVGDTIDHGWCVCVCSIASSHGAQLFSPKASDEGNETYTHKSMCPPRNRPGLASWPSTTKQAHSYMCNVYIYVSGSIYYIKTWSFTCSIYLHYT